MRLGPLHFAGLGQATVEDDVEGAAIGFPETLRSRLLGGELLLGVVVKLAQQPAFEVGVGGFWRGMLLVPDGELLAFEWLVVALDHGFFLSEFKVVVQPGVKRRARDSVVVVGKMFAALEHHVLGRAEQGVELLQFGKSFRGHILRPIVRGSHALRPGREQSGELFESAHDTAPPWRFISGPGELGDDWRAGAIAPSVDRAGRRFFFIAAIDGLDWRQAVAHGAFLTRNLEEAVYRGGQVYVPKGINLDDVNPRPISLDQPVNGLIGCVSADDRYLLAMAWDQTQELFQGVIVCLHNDPRVGGLKAGETKKLHGKVYFLRKDPKALLKRYKRDFLQ